MQLILYYAPNACSLVPYVTLTEAGAPFEVYPLNFRKSQHMMPEYLRLNPKHKVPLLIVDGNTAEQSNEDFIRGLITGKTEEQDRIRQKFHDDVAPQVMAAAFATETLAERVRQGADQDPEELKRIADLISNLVGGIRVAFGNHSAGPQDRQAS